MWRWRWLAEWLADEAYSLGQFLLCLAWLIGLSLLWGLGILLTLHGG